MKIVYAHPPNIAEIEAALGKDELGCVYAYGDTLYAPGFDKQQWEIEDHLMVHEQVHERQHGDDPAGWWKRYLADPKFRLDQEVEAYRAQWHYLKENYPRPQRRRLLKHIIKCLSGEMYGNIVSAEWAKDLVTNMANPLRCDHDYFCMCKTPGFES